MDNPSEIMIPIEIWLILRKKLNLLEKLINYFFYKENIFIDDWKELEKFGISEHINYSPQQLCNIVSNKKPQFFLDNRKISICEWCGGETFRLHGHHFPIRKQHGGTKTVDICGSCHDEYHFLEQGHYRLTSKTIYLLSGGRNV